MLMVIVYGTLSGGNGLMLQNLMNVDRCDKCDISIVFEPKFALKYFKDIVKSKQHAWSAIFPVLLFCPVSSYCSNNIFVGVLYNVSSFYCYLKSCGRYGF